MLLQTRTSYLLLKLYSIFNSYTDTKCQKILTMYTRILYEKIKIKIHFLSQRQNILQPKRFCNSVLILEIGKFFMKNDIFKLKINFSYDFT